MFLPRSEVILKVTPHFAQVLLGVRDIIAGIIGGWMSLFVEAENNLCRCKGMVGGNLAYGIIGCCWWWYN